MSQCGQSNSIQFFEWGHGKQVEIVHMRPIFKDLYRFNDVLLDMAYGTDVKAEYILWKI